MDMYYAAAYVRLSREDDTSEGYQIESNSIQSQREMILSYIGRQKDIRLYEVYVDDGWSGMNFDRPGFGRMMEDIRAGRVNCVIVKDLSRLGRDYIEVGRLLQRTFPAFSVRFIALTDDYDSLTADYNETAMVLPVKNFVNDSYCRDISLKVRSHQRVKRERGEFIGAFCVYGYVKCKSDRHVLVPDEYAAGIVRMIFTWKLEGYSNSKIAEQLKHMGVLSPMDYKRLQGEDYQTGFMTGVRPDWSGTAVKRILENEVYIGNLVQGRTEKINYKLKKCRIRPKEAWIRVAHTHQPIIPKEDFEIVQELLQMDTRASGGRRKAHRYVGILFCGDCMAPMVRRVSRHSEGETVQFICSSHNRSGVCSRHTISEKDLDEIVIEGIHRLLSGGIDKERMRSLWRAETGEQDGEFGGEQDENRVYRANIKIFWRELERLKEKLNCCRLLQAGLHEDLNSAVITEEEYHAFYEIYRQQQECMQEAVQRQERMLPAVLHSVKRAKECQRRVIEEPERIDCGRMTILTFLKRILVYEKKRVCMEVRVGE